MLNKFWYSPSMECYVAIKKELENLSFLYSITPMNTEPIRFEQTESLFKISHF